ncbi:dihydroxyacetone kinase subunit DhaK [Cylindrospermopsis raciborskii]|uniref:Dihydroxyacetone kinase subunit DhaK n=1 Tax=Cylindrospermopsis raciborskii CENA302 TaxID=1170768 RepID=A0A9Q5QUB8_9CYAN|nr:dihydroxyacetone kinase subunit DhaK [Cylindrospermopsis raciborskii]MCZ2202406.1 dihydroxyacetone kinase subunit DhaK [Cylindrospermopsis raciborskii PAMP2012]MCZ2206248.1 dihydroxyacetone kinase subunit DhaK [Cylindrospermopsis raciborskii PAMP2011]NLQ04760.1 dihydroxyacetone kinase subunit DhaK [Cylindrospermopsis raciborskii MVCC19]OHY33658.1 dihydroxyacetone kinase subunit DhaK [Cylindrospermopsis raciborskii MVCC14]OPH08469.1 dihydroxyacetone kinase subunit DhaK [Cylindrospermopsis ra
MKKLINQPENFVKESLMGMARAHSGLIKVNFDPTFVYRAETPDKSKVAIISGGGSGHEPMHTGFVGKGMLDAACPGEIFTSPTPDQMLAAAEKVDSGLGTLYIVKNYSGDIMNFEMATELARSQGIRTLNMIIDDDVAVKNSSYTQGRRGVGTTILAEKICGAAAEQGYDLLQVANLCKKVNLLGRSIGVALSSCTVPARGTPTFDLGDNQIELGIGIHGEPGRERVPLMGGDEVTEVLARSLFDDTDYCRIMREWDEKQEEWKEVELLNKPWEKGDRLLAFVNSMGGTPISELYLVYRKLVELCEQEGLEIVRNLIGPYMTSLEMQGCSITLLKLDEEMLDLWDAPVKTASLRWGV